MADSDYDVNGALPANLAQKISAEMEKMRRKKALMMGRGDDADQDDQSQQNRMADMQSSMRKAFHY